MGFGGGGEEWGEVKAPVIMIKMGHDLATEHTAQT